MVTPQSKRQSETRGRLADHLDPVSEAPIVHVVIVTWNKAEDVVRLLEQLKHINYPREKYQVTVVDNNSIDDTVQIIESKFPSVQLIRHSENLGGSGGFNAGMRWVLENKPEIDYLWLLDNDVLVDRNALKELVVVMENNPQAALCGSRIMNIANHDEILEVGALIDYRLGKSRRNVPQKRELGDEDSIFEVDYVSACSLLVRKKCVSDVGLLHDHLFIYWDDKEWGARFNAAGYKVLASNASVVYHPDWAGGRIADNSNIWRCYYGARNGLWFYNTYVSGAKRRLLLVRIVTDWMNFALAACMSGRKSLCRAVAEGIQDFFQNRYGRRDFQMPDQEIDAYLAGRAFRKICVFVPNRDVSSWAWRFTRALGQQHTDVETLVIVPEEVRHAWWADLPRRSDMMAFKRKRNGTIPWADRLNILKFLWLKPWNCLFAPPPSLRAAAVPGRYVAVVDFERNAVVSVEKVVLPDLLRLPYLSLAFLLRALVNPPKPRLDLRISARSSPESRDGQTVM